MNILKSVKSTPMIKIVDQEIATKDEDNCLICRIMRIQHERSDMVRWLLSSEKSDGEKIKIASLLTGINIDQDVLDCLNEPTVKNFILSE
ncbi:MAG: hypothetical protein JXA54_17295 [Candidatus Heimdallarchaeota archaeon]|nr:hypothetical protein [Candidatus Heimdallarchaeota archaeon]